MGFFMSKQDKLRYGVILDIGSGSVLVAIIESDATKNHPNIIWSKREYSPLRQIDSITDSAKSVMTSLINALMLLDSEGRKVLYEKVGKQRLEEIQVTIAAPWSYTATKTISYQNIEKFEISDELIEELLRTAQQKVQEELLENEKVNDLGLTVIARTTMQVIGNGYPIKITGKQKAESVKVIQASAVAQKYLIEAVLDAKAKILPNSELTQYSFMLPFFYIINDLNPNENEYCLVDVTYEATEIGVVRDGVLNYCTHVAYGSFSIAREISDCLSIPLEEAYGYLNSADFSSFIEQHTEKQKQEIKNILSAYKKKLSELFRETGDSLTIPKKIYLHGNINNEAFFSSQVLLAASHSTNMQHAVYNVTTELLTKKYQEEEINSIKSTGGDTALYISAQFFHTTEHHRKFEHL